MHRHAGFTSGRIVMAFLRFLTLASVFLVPYFISAEDTKDKGSNTWATIVVELFTPDASQKAAEKAKDAKVDAGAAVLIRPKELGLRLSAKDLTEKYGRPTQTRPSIQEMDGKKF